MQITPPLSNPSAPARSPQTPASGSTPPSPGAARAASPLHRNIAELEALPPRARSPQGGPSTASAGAAPRNASPQRLASLGRPKSPEPRLPTQAAEDAARAAVARGGDGREALLAGVQAYEIAAAGSKKIDAEELARLASTIHLAAGQPPLRKTPELEHAYRLLDYRMSDYMDAHDAIKEAVEAFRKFDLRRAEPERPWHQEEDMSRVPRPFVLDPKSAYETAYQPVDSAVMEAIAKRALIPIDVREAESQAQRESNMKQHSYSEDREAAKRQMLRAAVDRVDYESAINRVRVLFPLLTASGDVGTMGNYFKDFVSHPDYEGDSREFQAYPQGEKAAMQAIHKAVADGTNPYDACVAARAAYFEATGRPMESSVSVNRIVAEYNSLPPEGILEKARGFMLQGLENGWPPKELTDYIWQEMQPEFSRSLKPHHYEELGNFAVQAQKEG